MDVSDTSSTFTLRTPTNMTSTSFGIPCWNFYVKCISAYSWKRYVMKMIWRESHFLVTSHWTSYATKNELVLAEKAHPLLLCQACHAWSIIVSCRLANFERTSWSTQRCHKFRRLRDELATATDYDKFLECPEDNYPGVCNGRSLRMIDCRELGDPDCYKNLGIHVGRNPRIMRSTLGSKDYHELHRRLNEDTTGFLSG